MTGTSLPDRDSRRAQRKMLVLLALLATAALFAWLFHPQWFFFDTYHYMVLSYYIVVGDSHPLGFGFLLRALRWFCRALPHGSLPYFFQVWQTACLAMLVYLARPQLGLRALAGWERPAAVALALPAVALVLPAMIYLMNGYASEMTALLTIGIAALGFERGVSGGSVRSWVLFCAGCFAAWHIRYQLGALPVVAVAGAAVLRLRGVIGGAQLRRASVAAAVALAVSLGSGRLLATVFPTSGAARLQGGIFLQDSIQCSLRCGVRLYEVDCSSRHGRKMIRNATCTDLINDWVPLGRPLVEPYHTLRTFQHIGFLNTVKWLALAPFGYLRESYSFEHESFGFDRQIRILNVRQRELAPYTALLPPVGQKPSRPFAAVVRYLEWTYKARAHHWLCGALLLVSGLVIARARRASAVFIALAAIATYLAFSYLQPKAPLRYLATVTVLGIVAGWGALVSRREAREQGARGFQD